MVEAHCRHFYIRANNCSSFYDSMFAFNSPLGACPTCAGFGSIIGIDEKLVIPNTSLSVYDGCVVCWRGEKMGMWLKEFIRRAAEYDFPISVSYTHL